MNIHDKLIDIECGDATGHTIELQRTLSLELVSKLDLPSAAHQWFRGLSISQLACLLVAAGVASEVFPEAHTDTGAPEANCNAEPCADEGLALMRAFEGIPNPKVRGGIIALLARLAVLYETERLRH